MEQSSTPIVSAWVESSTRGRSNPGCFKLKLLNCFGGKRAGTTKSEKRVEWCSSTKLGSDKKGKDVPAIR